MAQSIVDLAQNNLEEEAMKQYAEEKILNPYRRNINEQIMRLAGNRVITNTDEQLFVQRAQQDWIRLLPDIRAHLEVVRKEIAEDQANMRKY